MPDTPYMSGSEVAARAGVNPETVRLWVRNGLLPAKRAGKRGWLRIERRDAERLLAQQAYR